MSYVFSMVQVKGTLPTLTHKCFDKIHYGIKVNGTELWVSYKTFSIQAGEPTEHEFAVGFSAYWVRAISSVNTTATVTFRYE